jgi:hypothetical protein
MPATEKYPEILSLTKVNNESGHQSTIKVDRQTFFHGGGSKSKSRLRAQFIGYSANSQAEERRKHEISLIERGRNAEWAQTKNLDQLWLAAKEAGLFVVPSMRVTDRNTVVMTDILADGTQLYGKGAGERMRMELLPTEYDRKYRWEPWIWSKSDDVFLQKTDANGIELIRQRLIQEILKPATKNGFSLSLDDCFESAISPDGKLSFIVLDLEGCHSLAKDEMTTEALQKLEEHNQICVDRGLRQILFTRKRLLELREKKLTKKPTSRILQMLRKLKD